MSQLPLRAPQPQLQTRRRAGPDQLTAISNKVRKGHSQRERQQSQTSRRLPVEEETRYH